ncbi:hypothetical protein ACFQU2_07775 [Siccirubricoccus deserti]
MSERTLRGKVAIAGIGETTYYKHGKSPDAEFKLALQAVLAACRDAGIDPREVDGFASYGNDRSDAPRLAAALGIRDCASPTCIGAAAAAALPRRWRMPGRRCIRAWRIASSPSAPSPRGSSPATAAARSRRQRRG